MEKKNLDKLFQKEFADFKAVPEDKVWAKIEASLDKKKKRRVIPIWWKLGGAAALLAVLMYVFVPRNTPNGPQQQIISDTNSTGPDVDSNKSELKDEKDASPFQNNPKNTPLTSTDNSARPNEVLGEKQDQIATGQDVLSKNTTDQFAQTVPQSNEAAQSNRNEGDTRFSDIFSKENSTAETVVGTNAEEQKNGTQFPNTSDKNESDPTEDKVAQTDSKESGKKSIFDAIAEQEEDKVIENKETYNRWAMGPSVAPVYFDAAGEGSPIHSNFTQNSKSGNLNLSYGLTVSYNVSKKLSLRSGIHRVDFGYDTNEISFSSSLQAPTSEIIDNINYSQSSRNLVVRSSASAAGQADMENPITTAEFNAPSNLLNGRMVQQLGYVEVPVELNYVLLDKKVGINVIGGVSSLFLVDNAVSLESEGLVTNLGSANNVNDINFSTNIGLGVNYKFTKKIQLNLEPVFKYQLNTFTDTAGSFRPYTIGVYSGVQFKF